MTANDGCHHAKDRRTAKGGSCDEKGRSTRDTGRNKSCKTVTCCLCILLVVAVIISLVVILPIPVPSPQFILNDVKIYTLNLTTTLTSNLQITLSSKNEDYDIGFRFDNLDVSASYRSQQITLPSMIPPSYLHNAPDVTVWSPYLNGTGVPLSPELAGSLAQDQAAGTLLINVEVTGRLSWKYKMYSLHCGLRVNCPAYVMFGNSSDTNVFGWAVKHPFGHEGCDTQVGKAKI